LAVATSSKVRPSARLSSILPTRSRQRVLALLGGELLGDLAADGGKPLPAAAWMLSTLITSKPVED
jgi:hypothetical protein